MDKDTQVRNFQTLDEALKRVTEQLTAIARTCIRQVDEGAEPTAILDLLQRVSSIAIETYKVRDEWHAMTMKAWQHAATENANGEPASDTVH